LENGGITVTEGDDVTRGVLSEDAEVLLGDVAGTDDRDTQL
jgi:hypothetical protein